MFMIMIGLTKIMRRKIMGYRSDVRIVTSPKGFKVLNDFVEKRLKQLKNKEYNLLVSYT